MSLNEDIERIKEVMGIRKPEVVRKGEFTNKYGEDITMALFDDGEVYFKHSDYGNEFFPIKSLIRKDIEGNSMFMIVLNQEEKDFVNNFLQDTKYQNESYNPIITESRDIFFKRRQNEFLDVLLTSFEWMDEFIEEMGSFEEYLKLILKHSIDAFFEFNDILVTTDEIEELLPIAFQTLRKDERLFRKVKEHYYSKKPDTTINESHETFFKRREHEFYNYIANHFRNVNPRRFDKFEDYLEHVLQFAIMIFFTNVADEGDLKKDELDELVPIALHHLKQYPDLYNEIEREYFVDEQDLEKSESVVNESAANFFKRRQRSILSDLYRTLDMLPAFGYVSLEDYVNQIVIDTLDITYSKENFEKPDIYKVDPVFDFVKQLLVNDKELFFLVKNKFKSYNPFKSTSMNESKEMGIIKRRIEKLNDYIIDSYHWLSPRRFRDFDEYLNRVIFSATRDFIADEIGGEYEDQLILRDKIKSKILELVKNHPIYNDIYNHYIDNI